MYDVLFLWKSTYYADPHNWIGEMYACNQIGQRNNSWYCKPEVDKLLIEALQTTDQEVRAQELREGVHASSWRMPAASAFTTPSGSAPSPRSSGHRASARSATAQEMRWASMDELKTCDVVRGGGSPGSPPLTFRSADQRLPRGMRIIALILKRLAWFVPTLAGLLLIVFFMSPHHSRRSGGVARGRDGATQAQIEALRAKLGLDRPLLVQFWRYLKPRCRRSRHQPLHHAADLPRIC